MDRVVLMLDGDESGRQGMASIAQTLRMRMPVDVISLEAQGQPDQLSSVMIRRLVDNARSTMQQPRDTNKALEVISSKVRIESESQGEHPCRSSFRTSVTGYEPCCARRALPPLSF